jgi:ATP-dependent Clp protease ATP-binding subunit ClpA
MHECNVDTDKLCGNLVAQFESRGLIADGASDPKPAADFERVIRQAVILVQHSGREEITGGNVLVAILAECESRAAYFLQEQDLTRAIALKHMTSPAGPGVPTMSWTTPGWPPSD